MLHRYGVRDIVVSSGTRCAPLTVAFDRSGLFNLHPIIDERSAAFAGLGMALYSGHPVALVCTSGSAPLNYAPALAEAYYRRVPLIAISADRPVRWVGQREGQTIRQAGCLAAIVRHSIDLPPDSDCTSTDLAAKEIDNALSAATGIIQGPVHLNIQIDTPICPEGDAINFDIPGLPNREVLIANDSALRELAIPANSKVMLVVGGIRLNEAERREISRLCSLPNIVVVAEAQSNIQGTLRPAKFDRSLTNNLTPDVLAIIGGDFVSGRFKQWLRSVAKDIPHIISATPEDEKVATFGRIDANIPCAVSTFATFLAHVSNTGDYRKQWDDILQQSPDTPIIELLRSIICNFKEGDLHISNGSAIRYIQHIDIPVGITVECNRGVSGIDGCTSTAIGSAIASRRPTLLITGDMSAAYDLNALAIRGIPDSFKMVVLDNNGGDIFRNIPTTQSLPELEYFFTMPPQFPVRQLAAAYDFEYFEASHRAKASIKDFLHCGRKAILNLIIEPQNNKNLI